GSAIQPVRLRFTMVPTTLPPRDSDGPSVTASDGGLPPSRPSRPFEYQRQIVGRHVDDLGRTEAMSLRERGHGFEVAHAPGRIALAQVAVECLVAGRGMPAPAA